MNNDDIVRKRILRSATALFNSCEKSYRENKCDGCPFTLRHGCDLYGHPIEWKNKLSDAKKAVSDD